ncbi:MAG: FAD-dependent oxidoreductase [Nannocystaceae bacterium]|nr:FAD-binding oxidoreductase [bacterium]
MPPADVVVVGGGLAGVLAAEVLHARGHAVRVIDRAERRASDAPCAIVHPFVGGSFAPRPNVEAAWGASRAWFLARASFVREEVVRRHLPSTKPGDRLLASWPKVEALARRMFAHVVPPSSDRFVEYGPVLAVDLQRLLAAERTLQRARGVDWLEGEVVGLRCDGSSWRVSLIGGDSQTASRVVVAAGVGALPLLRRFADVGGLARAEGTLAWAHGDLDGPFLIHGGHASGAAGRLAWGATYRMLEGDPRCPRRALAEIDARLREVGAPLPRLQDAHRWTGTRLVDTQTRTPWVREHAPGLWSMCAFGSQGCLWGPWSARRLLAPKTETVAG